VTKVTTSTV